VLYSSDRPLCHILSVPNSYTTIAQYVVGQDFGGFYRRCCEESSAYYIALSLGGEWFPTFRKMVGQIIILALFDPELEGNVIFRNVDKHPTTQRHIPGDFSLSCTVTTVSS
jgi:hypothetical protein